MNKISFFKWTHIFLLFSYNFSYSLPAHRAPGQNYLDKVQELITPTPFSKDLTVYDSQIYFNELPNQKKNDFRNYDEMFRFFKTLRDKQFIAHKKRQRRSSWMYPQDGCWLRAELMNRNLEEISKKSLHKIFIFGNLNVKTPYSHSGEVSWWYHVALVASLEGEYYILDPSIESLRPLKLQEWVLKQVPTIEQVGLSLCAPNAFNPNSLCEEIYPEAWEYVLGNQKVYLNMEEDLLVELGYDVDAYLGDHPPWN